ncbi:MAG: hypothetical protein A3J76_04190 [Candidatus Moranbacteria bacterium RBG_13_45_13]|nr:MAG: hypothetical protein A3J76_04190 [Candidatus Moranbacteria bacterium RBG_13_45_13]
MLKNQDFFRVEFTPEMVLATLRSMPEVISAEYNAKEDKFIAETIQGVAEIKLFLPRKDNEGTA